MEWCGGRSKLYVRGDNGAAANSNVCCAVKISFENERHINIFIIVRNTRIKNAEKEKLYINYVVVVLQLQRRLMKFHLYIPSSSQTWTPFHVHLITPIPSHLT